MALRFFGALLGAVGLLALASEAPEVRVDVTEPNPDAEMVVKGTMYDSMVTLWIEHSDGADSPPDPAHVPVSTANHPSLSVFQTPRNSRLQQ